MWVTGPARPISRARDAAVVRRGGLTVWFTEEAVVAWHATATGERGGQPVYSALAIETGLALRLVFHQPLRQTEGLLRSIVAALKFDIAVPDHTTLSRRGGGMMTLPKLARRDGAGSGGARRQGGRRNARWLETVPTVRCSTGCPGRGGSCGGSGRAPVGRGSTRSPGRGGSCGGSGAAPTGRCSTGRPERGGCGSGSGTAPTGPRSAGCPARCGSCGGSGRASSAPSRLISRRGAKSHTLFDKVRQKEGERPEWPKSRRSLFTRGIG